MKTSLSRSLSVIFVVLARIFGQDLPDKPMLRIERGMHSDAIRSIDVDAAEQYLVTGSNDKTARVWDLAAGRQLQVLRPPIGEDQDGRIYTVAISPDGRTVAAGGWLGTGGAMSIFLFDRQTGRISKRIAGLPEVVLHLSYSSDGRFLVAALGAKNGIRLYRTSDYAQVAEDRSYGGDSYGADFTAGTEGSSLRLVTTSFDGFIRLYEVLTDGSLRILTKSSIAGGQLPGAVKFSSDGSLVAVAFSRDLKVSVLSSKDLSETCSADTRGMNRGLASVAWSDDGGFLFAGGRHQGTTKTTQIIRWDRGGCGAPTQLSGGANTITAIHALKGGRLIFASGFPVVNILDRQGIKSHFLGPPEPREIEATPTFLISRTGESLCLGVKQADRPNCFSLADRSLTSKDPATEPSLSAPITSSLPITDWALSSTPLPNGVKLNRKLLGIPIPNRSRCLAIAPDRKRFLIGTDFDLRMYESSGRLLWKVPSGATGAVNISGDGRVAVAFFGDGTVRWYRAENGAKLLAAYASEGQPHWVAWTPSGYYDAGPGDEGLVGWHINRGRESAAEFYPASRFRAVYYRPDVVGRMLTTLDESSALQQANAEAGRRQQQQAIEQILPPQIRIVSPADGSVVSSTQVIIRYVASSASGEPITAVRALIDGRPTSFDTPRRIAPVTAGDQAIGDELELRVSMPQKDSEISVIAENRYSSSEAATIRLRWRGPGESAMKPKLYILAVGISAYPEGYSLKLAAKDAQDFVSAMQTQNGRLYRNVESKLLTDRDATKIKVLNGLEWIRKSATRDDVAMLFLSGHGDTDDTNGAYYFIPVDFDPAKESLTGVESSVIRSTVQSTLGKVLIFVDTCHAGSVMAERTRALGPDINAVVNELTSAENGAVVFASSTGKQLSRERDEWQNGAFTKALVDGLRGKADDHNTGTITVNSLGLYISGSVRNLTGGSQTPTMMMPQTIPDFPIAVRVTSDQTVP